MGTLDRSVSEVKVSERSVLSDPLERTNFGTATVIGDVRQYTQNNRNDASVTV